MEDPSILSTDKPFSTSNRLTIMILLFIHKKINFTELQKLLNLTPGNLDYHLRKLERAHLIKGYKKGNYTYYHLIQENLDANIKLLNSVLS